MTPSLFSIILQTDRQRDQPISSQRAEQAGFEELLLQSLWALLHFAAFGIDHGAVYIHVDQVRLERSTSCSCSFSMVC